MCLKMITALIQEVIKYTKVQRKDNMLKMKLIHVTKNNITFCQMFGRRHIPSARLS